MNKIVKLSPPLVFILFCVCGRYFDFGEEEVFSPQSSVVVSLENPGRYNELSKYFSGRNIDFTVGRREKPHVAFFNYWEGSLQYTTIDNEGKWLTPETVDGDGVVGINPSIFFDNSNNIHIVYVGLTTNYFDFQAGTLTHKIKEAVLSAQSGLWYCREITQPGAIRALYAGLSSYDSKIHAAFLREADLSIRHISWDLSPVSDEYFTRCYTSPKKEDEIRDKKSVNTFEEEVLYFLGDVEWRKRYLFEPSCQSAGGSSGFDIAFLTPYKFGRRFEKPVATFDYTKSKPVFIKAYELPESSQNNVACSLKDVNGNEITEWSETQKKTLQCEIKDLTFPITIGIYKREGNECKPAYKEIYPLTLNYDSAGTEKNMKVFKAVKIKEGEENKYENKRIVKLQDGTYALSRFEDYVLPAKNIVAISKDKITEEEIKSKIKIYLEYTTNTVDIYTVENIYQSGLFPSISKNARGNIYISFYRGNPYCNVGLATITPNNDIFTSNVDGSCGPYQVGQGTSLAVSLQGEPMVMYFGQYTSDLRVAVPYGGGWHRRPVATISSSGITPILRYNPTYTKLLSLFIQTTAETFDIIYMYLPTTL